MLRYVIPARTVSQFPQQMIRCETESDNQEFSDSFPRTLPPGFEPYYEWKDERTLIMGIRPKQAAPTTADATKPNDGVISTNETDVALESVNYNDLLTQAAEIGLTFSQKPKKAELIAAIRAKKAEQAAPTTAAQ